MGTPYLYLFVAHLYFVIRFLNHLKTETVLPKPTHIPLPPQELEEKPFLLISKEKSQHVKQQIRCKLNSHTRWQLIIKPSQSITDIYVNNVTVKRWTLIIGTWHWSILSTYKNLWFLEKWISLNLNRNKSWRHIQISEKKREERR